MNVVPVPPGYTVTTIFYEDPRRVSYRCRCDVARGSVTSVVIKLARDPTAAEDLAAEFDMLRLFAKSELIARAVDFIHKPVPCLLIEDIGAAILTDFLKVRSLSLLNKLNIAVDIASALHLIHSAGIAHLDLHPDVIGIRRTSLGLYMGGFQNAVRLPARANTVFRGIPAYMSPEQTGRMGQIVDARADLYSMGIILYEMFAEKLPFPLPVSSVEWTHVHLARVAPPMPDTVTCGRVPPIIVSIVTELLRKDRMTRYQLAYGVLHDLKKVRDAYEALLPGQTVASIQFPLRTLDRAATLSPPSAVAGREPELEALMLAFERTLSGSAHTLFINGYSGVGKTALVDAFIQRAEQYIPTLVRASGKCEHKRLSPLWAVAQMVEQLVDGLLTQTPATVAQLKPAFVATLGAATSMLCAMFPSIQRLTGPVPPEPEDDKRDGGVRRNALASGLQVLFKALSTAAQGCKPNERVPTILIFDDIQWADQSTLNFIESLMESRARSMLLVVTIFRSNEVTENPDLASLLERCGNQGTVTKLPLADLEPGAVHQIVADMLGSEPTACADLSALVYERTHGNPFFVASFLQAMHGENQLRFDFAKSAFTWNIDELRGKLNVSDNVAEMVSHRLKHISEEVSEILTCAACIGRQFYVSLLAQTVGRTLDDTRVLLRVAEEHGLVAPIDGAAGTQFKFLHDKIREGALQMHDSKRGAFHLTLAQILHAAYQRSLGISGSSSLTTSPPVEATSGLSPAPSPASARAATQVGTVAPGSPPKTPNSAHSTTTTTAATTTAATTGAPPSTPPMLTTSFPLIPGSNGSGLLGTAGDVAAGAGTSTYSLRIFAVADHFNQAMAEAAHVTLTPELLMQATAVNLDAVMAARKAVAFASAAAYAANGMKAALLMTNGDEDALWTEHYDVMYGLCITLIESKTDDSTYAETALKYVTNASDLGTLVARKCRTYNTLGKFKESLAWARRGFELLGDPLPEPEAIDGVLAKLNDEVMAELEQHPIGSLLQRPLTGDGDVVRAKARILGALIPVGYITGTNLYPLTTARALKLVLAYGFYPELAYPVAHFGATLARLKKFSAAYEIGALAINVERKYGVPDGVGETNTAALSTFGPLGRPFLENLSDLETVLVACKEYGSFQRAAFGIVQSMRQWLLSGAPLNRWVTSAVTREMVDLTVNAGAEGAIGPLKANLRACYEILYGDDWRQALHVDYPGLAAKFDNSTPAEFASTPLYTVDQWYGAAHALFLLVLGRAKEAYHWAVKSRTFRRETVVGQSKDILVLFAAGAALGHVINESDADDLDDEEYRAKVGELEGFVQEMREFHEAFPANFSPFYHIMNAELMRANDGNFVEVLAEYDDGLKAAAAANNNFAISLAHAGMSRLWHAQRVSVSSVYSMSHNSLSNAARTQWGCVEPLAYAATRRSMESGSSTMGLSNSSMNSNATITDADRPRSQEDMVEESLASTHLDALSVLKATRTISSELDLDRLQMAFLRNLMDATGAQHACILKPTADGGFTVDACLTGDGAKDPPPFLQLPPTERVPPGFLPFSLINLCIGLGQPVVISDARTNSRCANDPFVLRYSPASLMCAPLNSRGALLRVVYVQNDLVVGAFSRRRLAVFEGLSSQAAVSIENSLLYQELQLDKRRLEEARDQAVHANQIKSEFLATMSHEIRTPMNGILSTTALLTRSKLDPELVESVEIIQSAGEILLHLIESILDFSKMEAGKLVLDNRPLELHRALTQCIKLLEPAAGAKQLELHLETEIADPPVVMGDAIRLKQIVINLVNNAIKFTERGSVKVHYSYKYLDAASIELLLKVTDTGVGIEAHHLSRLFQSFSQIDGSSRRRNEGVGLGLVICQNLSALMGGSVRVESTIGQGSTFSCTLRFNLASPEGALLAHQTSPESSPGPRHRIFMPSPKPPAAYVPFMTAAALAAVTANQAASTPPAVAPAVAPAPAAGASTATTTAVSAAPPSPQLHPANGASTTAAAVAGAVAPGGAGVSSPRVGSQPMPALGASPSLLKAATLRVLAVDDNKINQRVLLKMLQRMGYTADIASNGLDAVTCVATANPAFDVVLMDVFMPGMDGVEATQRIRELRDLPHQPIIIAVTASAMAGDREKYIEAGMSEYIQKPINYDVLAQSLTQCQTKMRERLAAAAAASSAAAAPSSHTSSPPSHGTDSPAGGAGTGGTTASPPVNRPPLPPPAAAVASQPPSATGSPKALGLGFGDD